MTLALYLNECGEIAHRPMFCSKSSPRSKKKRISFTRVYNHIKPDKTSKIVRVQSERYQNFIIYRTSAGWNERAVLCKELELLNIKMKKQDRKIALTLDHAPCYLIGSDPLPDYSNITSYIK